MDQNLEREVRGFVIWNWGEEGLGANCEVRFSGGRGLGKGHINSYHPSFVRYDMWINWNLYNALSGSNSE